MAARHTCSSHPPCRLRWAGLEELVGAAESVFPITSLPVRRQRSARDTSLVTGLRPTAIQKLDFLLRMPLTIITADESQAGLAALEPEFLALLESKQAPVEIRALLGHLGVTRLSTFAHLEASEEAVCTMLTKDLGLDPTEGMRTRIHMASMVEVWKTARQRVQIAEETAAEARAQGRPRELMAPQAQSLRRAHSAVYGKLEDEEWPSRDYLAWRFSQFEEGEFRAETLSDVVNMVAAGDDGAEPSFSMLLTTTGKVATMRQRTKVDPPKTPEQMRRCYRLMATAWEVMKQVYPDRRMLAHYTSEVWNQMVSHLLGPKVAEYRSRNNIGISWAGLLEYEYRIRKHAMMLITEQGYQLEAALRAGWADPTLENRYFTLELVTSGEKLGGDPGGNAGKGGKKGGNKRALERELAEVKRLKAQLAETVKTHTGSSSSSTGGNTGSGGGKAKGGGKNNGLTIRKLNELRSKEELVNKDPQGIVICQFFNVNSYNRGSGCQFSHICLRCHKGGHTIFDCTVAPKPKVAK